MYVSIYRLKIDQLNLTVAELEDELAQLKSVHELKGDRGDQPRQRRMVQRKDTTRDPKDNYSKLYS